jgi:alkylation response protein AidB-like acyl-CoA dehydrogenase
MFISVQSDADQIISALVQTFAEHAAEHDEKASFPFENIEALRQAGLLALPVPKECGGRGSGLAEAERVINRIAQGEPSTALVLAQQYLFLKHIQESPTSPESLREKIFRSAVSEGALGNLLRVEPDLGSPSRGGLPATVARRVEGGWRLSGRKIYSTGIPALRWLAIWARTDQESPRVGSWIIPHDAKGIHIEETWNHLGMRASGSHDVILDDVFIPEDHAADVREPQGWLGPDSFRDVWLPVLFTTVYDGIAQAAREWLLHFLTTRVPSSLGAPLATLPRMQEAAGRIEALLYANRVLLQDLTARADAGALRGASESALVKLTVTNNAIEAVAKAIEVSGNPGLSRDNPLQRHYRDVLCARVHSPQNDSILLSAGRAALRLTS